MVTNLPKKLEIDGVLHDIRSDFRAVLDILSASGDDELTTAEKNYVLLKILYVNPENITNAQEALKKAWWFIACGNERIENKTSVRLMNWEKDFPILVGQINQILNYECRAVDYLHWWTFRAAYDGVGEGFFHSVVSIRYKLSKGKKLEKWEQEFYEENRDRIDINSDDEPDDEMAAILAEVGL